MRNLISEIKQLNKDHKRKKREKIKIKQMRFIEKKQYNFVNEPQHYVKVVRLKHLMKVKK